MSYIPVPGIFRVRMASTANLTLSGLQTIDGIVGAANDVVLAKDQTTGAQNGPYVMVAGAWARLAAGDNAAELVPGTLVIVSVGTANGTAIYELTNAAPIVVGTTALVFSLVAKSPLTTLAVTAPADVGTAAAVGVGTTAARADHVHDFNPVDTATVTWDFSTPGQIKANASTGGSAPAPATTVTDVIGTTSVVGVGTTYARNDHAHFHGNLPGGELHDLVNEGESGLPGFMSLADKSKLEGIEDNATFNEPSNLDPLPITDGAADAGVAAEYSRDDHVHVHGNLGGGSLHAVATDAAAGFMSAANHQALALWDLDLCRYFFIDNSAGNDASVGFLDRTPGHVFTAEMAAVDAAKIKTVERLLAILPRNGNGRMAKLLFKNRAAGTCYLMADGVTLADLDLTGIHGYRWIGRCGSTDLTNSYADRAQAGAIRAETGPNGDFSFTADTAGGSGVTIAAGSFGTDADNAGRRVRFKGNVTPAAADLCLPIWRVNSTTSITYGRSAGLASPSPGDDFFLERIGVTFNNVYDISEAATMSIVDGFAQQVEMVSPMVGIQAQADVTGGVLRAGTVGASLYAFCASRDGALGLGSLPNLYSNRDAGQITFAEAFVDEIGESIRVGPCKFDGVVGLQAQTIVSDAGALFCTTATTARATIEIAANDLRIAGGGMFRYGGAFSAMGGGSNRLGDGGVVKNRYGTQTTRGAGLLIRTGSGSVICNGWQLDSVETSTDFGVVVTGGPRAGINAESLGSGPNVGFDNMSTRLLFNPTMRGISLVNCWQGRFYIGSVALGASEGVMVWGTGNNNPQMPFENFTRNNLIDLRGNEIQGSAGRVNSAFLFVKGGNDAVAEGDVVSSVSASGGIPAAVLSVADSPTCFCVGVALIALPGAFAGYSYLATAGHPYINGSAGFTTGDILYLDPVTQGKTVNVSPTPGAFVYKQRLGNFIAPENLQLAIELVATLADGNA